MVARRIILSLLMMLGLTRHGRAVDPIPFDKRILAAVITTIAAPPDQPMHMPTDVAVDSLGRIYVADGANDRILRFTPDRQLDLVITSLGKQSLKRPVGISVDASNQLWIADTANHRLVVQKADGTLAHLYAPEKVEWADSFEPTDVAVSADSRRVYAIDNANHRVLILDVRTGKWTAMGSQGRALGQFLWPFMVCIGSEKYVYVTEAIGSRVQLISPNDLWAGEIGQWGVELGQFYRPKGITADRDGRIFVSDSTLGVIQVFSARGALAGVLTDEQGIPLRFKHSMGMCFDKEGKLYVVELAANRVAVVSVAPAPATEKSGNAEKRNER